MSHEQQTNFASGRGVLEAQMEGGANPGTLGAQLFATSDSLRENPSLLRALTDAGRDSAAREGLAAAVFGPHVDGPTLTVIKNSVGGHWNRPDALAAELGELGLAAYVAEAKDVGGVDVLCQQLVDVMGVVSRNRDLRVDLSDLGVGSPDDRAELACKIFKNHLDAPARALVRRAVFTTQYGELIQKLRKYAETAAWLTDKKLVIGASAAPLSEKQQTRLTYLASKRWNTPVLMTWDVDPDLVGGFRLDMGEQAVDTSVRSDLQEARLALTS